MEQVLESIKPAIYIRRFLFNHISIPTLIGYMVLNDHGVIINPESSHGPDYGYFEVCSPEAEIGDIERVVLSSICEAFENIDNKQQIMEDTKLSSDEIISLIKSSDANLFVRVNMSLKKKNDDGSRSYYIEERCS